MMLRTSLVTGFVSVLIATSAMLAPATAQKPGDPKTVATARWKGATLNHAKVTAVNASAATFTAITPDGKQFTFAAPKGKPLPEVGKVYDITYTENPGGGPLQTATAKAWIVNNF
jgi:hypothetical protein